MVISALPLAMISAPAFSVKLPARSSAMSFCDNTLPSPLRLPARMSVRWPPMMVPPEFVTARPRPGPLSCSDSVLPALNMPRVLLILPALLIARLPSARTAPCTLLTLALFRATWMPSMPWLAPSVLALSMVPPVTVTAAPERIKPCWLLILPPPAFRPILPST
ncbi:hypothetical protein D3C72_1910340 [compost metagenome]